MLISQNEINRMRDLKEVFRRRIEGIGGSLIVGEEASYFWDNLDSA